MHPEAYRWVATQARTLKPVNVLEIGAKDINGSVRNLFPGAHRYHGIDIREGEGVDEVASGADYDPPFVPDLVICAEVLEHSPDGEAICRNADRILAPGGVLLLTAAGDGRAPHSAIDGLALRPGEHYANILPGRLARWLSDFPYVRIVLDRVAHDIYARATKGG